jgi:hypothetical protein
MRCEVPPCHAATQGMRLAGQLEAKQLLAISWLANRVAISWLGKLATQRLTHNLGLPLSFSEMASRSSQLYEDETMQ